MQRWLDGDRTAEGSIARGGNAGGMLSELIVSNEQSLVPIPNTSPTRKPRLCRPRASPHGWACSNTVGSRPATTCCSKAPAASRRSGLIFAAAAGAKPIITSSSDTKLERARKLGAFGTVNYRTNPDWEKEVRTLTGGAGVKQVLEVGGADTFAKALEALALDGHVAMIGTLSGFAPQIPTGPLFGAGAHLTAIFVGARADFEAMNAFIAEHEIHPVIDRVFEFEQAPAAFDLMADGDYMGRSSFASVSPWAEVSVGAGPARAAASVYTCVTFLANPESLGRTAARNPTEPMPETSDSELMRQVRQGRSGALATLFERHHARLYRYCVRMTGDRRRRRISCRTRS